MTLPLHTGARTSTIAAEWSVWDIPCRLVVTDPWQLKLARQVLEEQLTEVVGVLRSGRRRARGGAAPVPPTASSPAERPAPFPYGIALAPDGAEVHRDAPPTPRPEGRRAGLLLEPGAPVQAWAAQLCAERVAEATSCGALVALGDHVATSGLAPAGGWRVELDDVARMLVALDGGAVSQLSTGVPGPGTRGGALRIVVPATGRAVLPVWRSVIVAAGDAPSASIACTGALLRGTGAPDWLDAHDLPARLVDTCGRVHLVGRWPAGS